MPQVEAVGLAAGQDFQPHRQALGISLGQQDFQDRGAEPGVVEPALEIEGIDLPAIRLAAEADAADALVALIRISRIPGSSKCARKMRRARLGL